MTRQPKGIVTKEVNPMERSSNIRIDPRLHIRLKKFAQQKGRWIGHVAEEAINLFLKKENRCNKK